MGDFETFDHIGGGSGGCQDGGCDDEEEESELHRNGKMCWWELGVVSS